ncbi:DNA alkylation repair protein [Flaviaesturariibacter terrae]
MNQLLSNLRAELAAAADPRNREGAQRFFKESIDAYGLKMADTRSLAAHFGKELKGSSKDSVFAHCDSLWRSGKMEEAHIAAAWVYARRKEFTESDLPRFESWIDNYVRNWAACDDFCNKTMGAFFEKFPRQWPVLQRWAAAPNRWLRRASAVSLIDPARRGRFLTESLDIARRLLHDDDDLVQKGYGWLLKEHCKKNEATVYDFVRAHKSVMPRTALRYAIEKMPLAAKRELMEK